MSKSKSKSTSTSNTCSSKSVYSHSPQYVCNPLSGRWIRMNGPTYQKLQQRGIPLPQSPLPSPHKTCGIVPITCNPWTGRWVKNSSRVGHQLQRVGMINLLQDLTRRRGKHEGPGQSIERSSLGNSSQSTYASQSKTRTSRGLEVSGHHQPSTGTIVIHSTKKPTQKGPEDVTSSLPPSSTLIIHSRGRGSGTSGPLEKPWISGSPGGPGGPRGPRGPGSVEPKPFEPNRFKYLKQIGKGTYGTIWSVEDQSNGHTIVIKQIKQKIGTTASTRNEIEILNRLQQRCQPYILCYIDYMIDQNFHYILTEYLDHYVTLSELFGNQERRITHPMIQTLVENLQKGLSIIHQQTIAHRDIKPGNIMVNPSTMDIKYIDFGNACTSCYSAFLVGTLDYIAPELISDNYLDHDDFLLKQQPSTFGDWLLTDLWSLGVTIAELLLGETLYIYIARTKVEQMSIEAMKSLKKEHGTHLFKKTLRYIRDHEFDTSLFQDLTIEFTSPVKEYLVETLTHLLQRQPHKRRMTL